MDVTELKIKIFADGADVEMMLRLRQLPLIKGFTTNPTLMRKGGVSDYKGFALRVLESITEEPVSFEVFSDDFAEMEDQALEISSWGSNVNVKIPITNTQGKHCGECVHRLARAGVKLNVTALMTLDQVKTVAPALTACSSAYVSVFAGRIADTGRDPVPAMQEIVEYLKAYPMVELIWASPRELLNIFQADAIGCHVITVNYDVLDRLRLVGKDLSEYSLETVKMFHDDARKAGYTLPSRTRTVRINAGS
jgi:transaldolase